MESISFVIVRNARLEFKDSTAVVESFIKRRLNFAGITDIRFANSLAEATDLASSHAASRYVAIADALNPFIDLELVSEMRKVLQRTRAAKCTSEGAVPGTQIHMLLDRDLRKDLERSRVVVKRWHTQQAYNNQFNLYKYKRLKLFLSLLKRIERMHEMSVSEFVRELERDDDVFAMLVGFGEDVRLEWHSVCPHCSGALVPLPMHMSQPFCGYLPAGRPLYHECEACGLVVMSPAIGREDTHRIYDEFDKQDFVRSTNNPYDGSSPRCDFRALSAGLPPNAALIDLGGGVGHFSEYVKAQFPYWSVTHSDFAIKRNEHLEKLGIETRELDFVSAPIGLNRYDVITAWEVIEHVPYESLAVFLKNVHNALRSGGYFVFSTPDFDSPLCRSFDFYAVCPPFHYLVFGERWLRSYFEASSEWRYLEPRYCSDFLDDGINWAAYGEATCPTMQTRATAAVLGSVFAKDTDRNVRRQLLQDRVGTEVIVTLQKRS